jgi:putative Holliday junction resolvase
MRILAIDPGIRRIGLAISDPTGTIANPLMVLEHLSKEKDSERIAIQAELNSVNIIILGQSLDDVGLPSFEGRRSARLADMLRRLVSVPVILWNEGFSTKDARNARIMMGASKKQRSGHLDALAATIILQSYLDSTQDGKQTR